MKKLSSPLLAAGIILLSTLAIPVSAQMKSSTGEMKYRLQTGVTDRDYQAGVVNLRVKEQFRANSSPAGFTSEKLQAALTRLGATQVRKKFPNNQPPSAEALSRNPKLVDLSLIYEITYSGRQGIEEATSLLLATGEVVYAEPAFIQHTTFVPNDPQAGSQYHLAKIQALAAWNVQQGDTNVIIGIVDSGLDLDHPDLEPNIKKNYADPVNGIDDDNDGFIDNYLGWDFAGANDQAPTSDNNPNVMSISGSHGVHVGGLASAATNNNKGVAGVGFKCKLMAVKCGADNNGVALYRTEEGIAYAADHGCKIINCSFGNNSFSQLGQDVVDYVVNNHNALIVAAAGNANSVNQHYPAGYEGVLSVASTNASDIKSGFSNFGYRVDVSAPGSNVLSTYFDDAYASNSGTSMASPVAAGAAALVLAQFPSFTGEQVAQQLRATADKSIYNIGPNQQYAGKLGTGRIDVFQAVTQNATSVRMIKYAANDNNNNVFVPGDTVTLDCTFKNYLSPTSAALTATLTTTSPYVQILDGTIALGAMATLQTTQISSDPFRFVLSSNAPTNLEVSFKVTFTDGTYQDQQYFLMKLNVTYLNIEVNDIHTTMTSIGRIGWNDTGNQEGLGFRLDSTQMLYEMGLMVAVSPSRVSNAVRGAAQQYDEEFSSLLNVKEKGPVVSDYDLAGRLDDSQAGADRLFTQINYRSYAWSQAPHHRFVIVEYRIQNTGTSTLTNFYAGLFADWDIMDYNRNLAGYHAATKLGYAFSNQPNGKYAGIKLLGAASPAYFAIDNNGAGGNNSINVYDGYSDSEKWQTLSSGIGRAAAGTTGTGNDISHTLGAGPFSIPAGDSIIVAFALIGADSLAELITSGNAAETQYGSLLATNAEQAKAEGLQLYPNPTNGQVFLKLSEALKTATKVQILDALGREAMQITVHSGTQQLTFDMSSLSNGLYLVKLQTAQGQRTAKIRLNR